MTVSILWFRNDLRLDDNPALHAAAAGEFLPLYILDERAGAASRWWLYHSLAALSEHIPLILRRGDPARIIPDLAAEVGAEQVHTARSFEPAMRDADRLLDGVLRKHNVAFHRHLSTMLFAPESIKTKTGGPYGVYTPFSKACMEAGVADERIAKPHKLNTLGAASDKLEDWSLLPTRPDWAGGLRETWTPGEAGAEKRLGAFLKGPIHEYDAARNLPGSPGTSMLSPHVHFGEISPRRVWHRAAAAGKSKGVETFLKELLWREFSINLLWQHQTLRTQPIRGEFAHFPWAKDKKALKAWQKGQTGIPIVDAGMRQLWHTGWMHNRVRMICASFLTKHLLLPWQLGEQWFWDTLCEADEAANGASWQWVAGCGADAAPYFRVFNPVLQGKKFDANGDYVREYVPELAQLPDEYIHAPWEAGEETLARANIELGQTYPPPIMSLNEGRERALKAYEKVKG